MDFQEIPAGRARRQKGVKGGGRNARPTLRGKARGEGAAELP